MPKILDFKAKASQPFSIKNKSATTAEIVIYTAIGESYFGDSLSAKQFSDELSKLDSTVNQINLRINSPGGSVFDGIAIYNRLKQHKANVTVYIDGLAASIASVIALAGDEIIIGEGALFMIHLPWTFAGGNRMELENMINRLMDVEEQIISIYSKKSKMGRSDIRALLEAETWLDADQAIEMGFVDSKFEDSLPIAASALGASWIHKRPKNFKSETKVIDTVLSDLKNKIKERLARK